MKYLIGLDIGTSSVKGVLMDENKKIIAERTVKHNYYYDNGLKLLNADEFCDGCIKAIKELSNKAEGEVIAVCASGASGNLMFSGKENSPVYNWQNQFDKDVVDKYIGKYNIEDIRKIVGWGKNYSFPLAALAYIKETDTKALDSADMICMSIEYLNYKLTGNWGITRSMGTPFYLIDQEKGEYYKEFLDIFGITEDKLPPIMENYTVLGSITNEISEKAGLSKNTKVILGTFDHPSAARGAGVFEEDEILLSCGTSWVALIPFDKRSIPLEKEMLVDPFMYPYGNWCGMKSIASISDKIENCKKKYFGDISYAEFDTLAKASSIGAEGVKIDLDDVDGITVNAEKRHIARAIAEAAANNKLKDMILSLGINVETIKIVGGITNSNLWLSVISEVCNVKVEVVNGECAGAAGAALMAGVGVGIFENERM